MSITISDLYQQLFGRGGTAKGTDIDMAEHGRQGGVSTGQGFKFTDGLPYATKITVSGSYTYIGIAAPGTSEASALWQCKRIYDDGAGTTTFTWADGNENFDNTSTDLTSLTYS